MKDVALLFKRLFTKYRELTVSMTWEEIRERHSGQILGFFWTFFYPVIFLGVYVFIFAFVFKAKTGIEDDSRERVLFLLSGLIPWMTVTDLLGRASNSISMNANLVKQVVFPIEVLPVKSVLAALFNQCIFIGVYFCFWGFLGADIGLGIWLLLPGAILFQAIALFGIAFLLSSIAVFLRDVREMVRVFTFMGMFTTPVLLRVDQVPKVWAALFYMNPFSYMIWAFQDAMTGRISEGLGWVWILYGALSFLALLIGAKVFERLRTLFGNVL